MVVKKRIYFGGFHGLISPVIPKAPRSLRRRTPHSHSHTKPSEVDGICAFELLAAVAGKLLQESEVKVNPVPPHHHDQGSGTESQPTNPTPTPTPTPTPSLNDFPHSDTNSDVIQKTDTNLRIEASEVKVKHIVNDINLGDNRIESIKSLTEVNPYGLKDDVGSCVDNRVVKKPCSRVHEHVSIYGDHVHRGNRGNVNIGIRDDDDDDDDEKLFRYNYCSSRRREFGSRSRVGYKRMRNLLTSRYRKVAPKPKIYGSEVRSFYHKRKNIYMREQYEASKRRKSFHHTSKTPNTKDTHVKFSIKSFKVPELYVEVPETATIGSLKRSVMEAITAILQNQLHVGVVVQGKKVRDDNWTLQQSGISQKRNLETLGFTLECSTSPPPSPVKTDSDPDPPLLLPCNSHEQNREQNEENRNNNITELIEEQVADSKAIVVVPDAILDPEVVSVTEKPIKRFEASQRRTRRPFSVSEVEALVEAVETLGAGRWRDVKMRAFDNANHRTYVDLKDKWKTLVHTASISPQQRRGEPVPQDVLDRVLAAHAYWSQQQCKKE
ncbi:hypothetical protein LXL04_021923 [Taraxacum kok-saghyz]